MTGKFKYIIVESTSTGTEQAILLPLFVSHDQAVNPKVSAPLAAGFCEIANGQVTAAGVSTSLNLASRAQDAGIIRQTLLMSGVKL